MEGKRFLRSIELKNILSYGPEGVKLELEPLNVLIGPNGSGKSNLIQALRILQEAPNDFAIPIREGGGIEEWIWKGARSGSSIASIGVQILSLNDFDIGYDLEFTAEGSGIHVLHEEIRGRGGQRIYYMDSRYAPIETSGLVWGNLGAGEAFEVHRDLSILAQLRDQRQDYPELTNLRSELPRLAFFQRSWLDRGLRRPQPTGRPDNFLTESGHNLGLVLSGLLNRTGFRRRLIEKVQLLYPQVEDFGIKVQGGMVQLLILEAGLSAPTPATRISDGTFRYLCLLSILLHPKPPPLVCIEEPELGLHPDAASVLGELLVEASSRTQLIVTTHSPSLISALSNVPEAVVVCERDENGTQLRRLEPTKLVDWLNDYSLGDAWLMGAVGGNR
jgi:predicted ATPase